MSICTYTVHETAPLPGFAAQNQQRHYVFHNQGFITVLEGSA